MVPSQRVVEQLQGMYKPEEVNCFLKHLGAIPDAEENGASGLGASSSICMLPAQIIISSPLSPTSLSFCVKLGENLIGRNSACDVAIAVGTVSRAHCLVTVRETGTSIIDLHSKHGLWINNTRLDPGHAHPVRLGQKIKLVNLPGEEVSFILQ